jgi:uncharacterized membrane protein
MRSKASYKGHPIHPALIPFPFAFLYGAFFFDLAGRLAARPSLWTTGSYLSLVGIVAALVAAVRALSIMPRRCHRKVPASVALPST